MTQQIVQTNSSNLPAAQTHSSEVNTRDIVLPLIVLRQKQFKKPEYKKFKEGDILFRPTFEKIADEKEAVNFVPISCEPVWITTDITDSDKKFFVSQEPRTSEDRPYEFDRGGRKYRNDRAFVAHVLLRDQLDSQKEISAKIANGEVIDPEDMALPARITFSRFSFGAGKTLYTHFEMSKSVKQPASRLTFSLKAVEVTHKGNTFHGFVVEKAAKNVKYTPAELWPVCDSWSDMLAKNKYRSHDDDEAETDTVSAAPVEDDKRRF